MKKNKIIVLCGGTSSEREVSLYSGTAVYDCLKNAGYDVELVDPISFDNNFDLVAELKNKGGVTVFNTLHGGDGENGILQVLMQEKNIRFTGSHFRTCTVTMDKYLSSMIANCNGVSIPKTFRIKSKELNFKHNLQYPVVVKPNDSGSSIATYIVREKENLETAVINASKYSEFVLIQEYIPGRELTVAIVCGDSLPVVEIVPKSGWYDFNNKYVSGEVEYVVPAELSREEEKKIIEFSLKLWDIFDCKDYSRFDFRYDGNNFYFLEINTLPGMTNSSLVPKAAQKSGISFLELIKVIMHNSLI